MPTIPKTQTLHWTHHSKEKMRFYRLSEARVKRVLNSPNRVEEGIAPNTLAMMQPASLKTFGKKQTWKQEIWVMIQEKKRGKSKLTTIISAWRYPGVTKPRDDMTLSFIRSRYEEYLDDEKRSR